MVPCGLKESCKPAQERRPPARHPVFVVGDKSTLLSEKLQLDADVPDPVDAGVAIQRRRGVVNSLHQVLKLALCVDRIPLFERGQIAFQRKDGGVARRAALRFIVQHDGAAIAGAQPRHLREPCIADTGNVVHRRLDCLLRILKRRRRVECRAQQVKRMVCQHGQVVTALCQHPRDELRISHLLSVMRHFHRIFAAGVGLDGIGRGVVTVK